MISNQSLTCPKGTSLTFEIDMDTGSDLTGATAQWALCESWFDQAKVYLTKAGTGDGLFIGQDAGVWKITVNLAPTDTLDIPSGLLYHDCKVLLQSGDVEDVANGPFSLDPSVNILDTNAPITRNLHAVQLLGRLGQNAPLTVAWLARNLLATQSLFGLGQSAAGTVTSGAVSPDFQVDFTALTSLPSWLSLSRASNAMVFDSTGKLTYGPNNILLQSNNFSDAAWAKSTVTISSGVSDPDGGTNASTLTATSNTAYIAQSVSIDGTYINSIWVRRRTGSGTVTMSVPDNGSQTTLSLTGSWQRLFVAGSASNSPLFTFALIISTSGDAVDIYQAQGERVTYETTPRTYNPTTSAAYYGPRFDHDPVSPFVAAGLLIEEQRTNLFLQSNNFTNAAWSQTGTAVSASGTAPDGVSSAYTFNMSASIQSYVSQVVSFTAGISGAVFVYAKASASGGASNIRVTTNNTAAWGTGISTKTALTSQWERVGTVGTLISSGTDAKVLFGNVDETSSNDADCIGNVDIAFAQAEAGSFATSYIPTTTAAVTRSADIPSSTSPLTGYLAAGPSVWEFQDEATGTIARSAYAAGAFDWPVDKWYRSMGVYPSGTDTSGHITVGSPY